MAELQLFQLLKQEVLLTYQKRYPYFQGNWKSFSSQDIQNLIELIEEKTKQNVSEKWIYTHLKPEINIKLPRRDMLDILSGFSGYSSWDEFVFKQNEGQKEADDPNLSKSKRKNYRFYVLIGIGILATFFALYFSNKKDIQTIQLKDAFTKDNLQEENINAYAIEKEEKIPLKVENSQIQVEHTKEKTKIVIEGPYYKKKEVDLSRSASETAEILLVPDDYAMMLKAFMKSDIKDWETRKLQLNKILSDNLEVIVLLKDNLGAEYFNKREFSEKLIVPTETVRKMKIIEIKNDAGNKIEFIRIKQE